MKLVRCFGGDASEERAEKYAKAVGGRVVRLNEIPFEIVQRDTNLNASYQDSWKITYEYGVVIDNADFEEKYPHLLSH